MLTLHKHALIADSQKYPANLYDEHTRLEQPEPVTDSFLALLLATNSVHAQT